MSNEFFEQFAGAADSVSDLADIDDELEQIAAREDLSGPQFSRVLLALRKRLQAQMIRRKMQKIGGINPKDLRGLVATPRSLYATRQTTNAALAANTQWKFFHVGVDDDFANLGWTTGTPLDERYTNMAKHGRIPEGEMFVANGISFEFPRTITQADLENFQDAVVTYKEASGAIALPLGQVREMPAVFGLAQDIIGVGASAAYNNVHRDGPRYMSRRPLFTINGNLSAVDSPQLVVTHTAGFTLSATTVWTARLHGIWYQHRASNR